MYAEDPAFSLLCKEVAEPVLLKPIKLFNVQDCQPSLLNVVVYDLEFLSLQKHSRRKVLYVKESQQLHCSFKETHPSAHSLLLISMTDRQPLGDCTLQPSYVSSRLSPDVQQKAASYQFVIKNVTKIDKIILVNQNFYIRSITS
eukprot:TRINITY_DN1286_c0_g1_i6.p3 TRINITY_DN1286_c0_g1~~TRINITY_DN1286_c0_g1_i6.p3  ORF type:complete len:144 (+),score=2.33 TRINITY_DN1286_c0_g1_i6:702-1133(+)